MAGVSPSVVKGLVKQGVVAEEDSPRDLPYPRLDPAYSGVDLTPEQAIAAETLRIRCRVGELRHHPAEAASPDRARPRSTSKPSPKPCAGAGRRWSCCPRSR